MTFDLEFLQELLETVNFECGCDGRLVKFITQIPEGPLQYLEAPRMFHKL